MRVGNLGVNGRPLISTRLQPGDDRGRAEQPFQRLPQRARESRADEETAEAVARLRAAGHPAEAGC